MHGFNVGKSESLPMTTATRAIDSAVAEGTLFKAKVIFNNDWTLIVMH